MNKLVKVLFSLSMVLSMAPTTVYAEGEESSAETDGNVVEVVETATPTETSSEEGEPTVVVENENSELNQNTEVVEESQESNTESTEVPSSEETTVEIATEPEETAEPSADTSSTVEEKTEETTTETETEVVEATEETVEDKTVEEMIEESNLVYSEDLEINELGEYVLDYDDFSDAVVVKRDGMSRIRRMFRSDASKNAGEAKVTSFQYLGAYTGTGPFNADDNPGHDSAQRNDVVRSYDRIVYRTSYATESTTDKVITSGTIKFTAMLEADPSVAKWDLDSMAWLNVDSNEVETIDGKKYQVLRGTVLFSGGQLAPRIGVNNWVVGVNGAENGTVIPDPTITFELNNTSKTASSTGTTKVSSKPSMDASIEYAGQYDDETLMWTVKVTTNEEDNLGIKGKSVFDGPVTIDLTLSNAEFKELIGDNVTYSNGKITVNNLDFYKLDVTGNDYDATLAEFTISTKNLVAKNTGYKTAQATINAYTALLTDAIATNNTATATLGNEKGTNPQGASGFGPVNHTFAVKASNSGNDEYSSFYSSYDQDVESTRISVGDVVNFASWQYSEPLLWDSTDTNGVNKIETYFKFDGTKYDLLEGQEAYGLDVGIDAGATGGTALPTTSMGVADKYASEYQTPALKLFYVVRTDGSTWSSDADMADTHINFESKNDNKGRTYEFVENAADIGDRPVVAFLITQYNMENVITSSVLSSPYAKNFNNRIYSPYVKVNTNILTDSNGNGLNRDDARLVSVVLQDSYYYTNNGSYIGHLSSSTNDSRDLYSNKTGYSKYVKPTYGSSGENKSLGTSHSSWYEDEGPISITNRGNMAGASFYPAPYYYTVDMAVTQQDDSGAKLVYNLDKGQNIVDIAVTPGSGPVLNTTDQAQLIIELPTNANPVSNSGDVFTKYGITVNGTLPAYTVEETGGAIVFHFTNLKIGDTIPAINFKVDVNSAQNNDDLVFNARMASEGANNVAASDTASVGITVVRSGGAIIEDVPVNAIRTNENDHRIGFNVHYEDLNLQGNALVYDVLEDLGDNYVLSNISYDGDVTGTFYYTTQANPDKNGYTGWTKVTNFAEIPVNLLDKHITAFAFELEPKTGSTFDLSFSYNWADSFTKLKHEALDEVTNTVRIESSSTNTFETAKSISNMHVLVIDYLEKDTESIMWKQYQDFTKDEGDSYSVVSPKIAGFHLVDATNDTTVTGNMPSKFHYIKVYYERDFFHGDLVTVYKTANPGTSTKVTPGQEITYYLNARNTGAFTSSNIVIEDPLPIGTTFISADNGGTYANGKVTWNLAGLAAGASKQVSFKVRVNNDMNEKVVYNMATYWTTDQPDSKRNTVVTEHPLGNATGGTIIEAAKGYSNTSYNYSTREHITRDGDSKDWGYVRYTEVYTIPYDGTYTFTLRGAGSGLTYIGGSDGVNGGRLGPASGGYISVKYDLKAGDILNVTVGQKGGDWNKNYNDSNANGWPKSGSPWGGIPDSQSGTGWWNGSGGGGGDTTLTIARNGTIVGSATAVGANDLNGNAMAYQKSEMLNRASRTGGSQSGGTELNKGGGCTGNGSVSMTAYYDYWVGSSGTESNGGQVLNGNLTDGVITYTLSISNNNALPMKDVVLVDPIPAGTEYVNGSASGNGSHNTTKNRVEWFVGELKSNETKTYSFKVKVDGNSSLINNQALYGRDIPQSQMSTATPGNSTNIVQHVIEGNLTIMKQWERDAGKENQRPASLTMRVKDMNTGSTQDVIVTAANGWVASVKGLDTSHTYKVWEINCPSTYDTSNDSEATAVIAVKSGTAFIARIINRYAKRITSNPEKFVYDMKGNNINGQTIKQHSVLDYVIQVETDSGSEETLSITDKLPSGTTFVSASDNGQYYNGTVTWNIKVQGKKYTRVHLYVIADDPNMIGEIHNKATVTFDETKETNEVVNYLVYMTINKNLPITSYNNNGKTVALADIWGEPTFVYKIQDANGDVMYKSIEMGRNANGSVTFNLPHDGDYTVQEISDARYKLSNIVGNENVRGTSTTDVIATVKKVTQKHAEVTYYNKPNWNTTTEENAKVNQIKK